MYYFLFIPFYFIVFFKMWYETAKHDLRLALLLCLDAREQFPRLSKCHEMGGSQDWRHADSVSDVCFFLFCTFIQCIVFHFIHFYVK